MITRYLKVYQRFYDNEFRDGEYPEIRLAGNWLRNAGFAPHENIKVIVDDNHIIIVKK